MCSTLKLRPCPLLLLLLLLLHAFSPLALAQPGGFPGPGPPQQQPPPPQNLPQSLNPIVAIVMVALITAFFILGCFFLYVRRCLDRRYLRVYGGSTATPAYPSRGPQWDRRAPVGLDASVIDTFPTFLYSAVKRLKVVEVSLECAVCLNEFEDDETLRLIPRCNHVFHPDCIDTWLASHVTCPVCRSNLAPGPGELPPDDGSVGPVNQAIAENVENRIASEVCIPIVDEGSTPVPHETQSQEANLLHENRSIRSWSNGWLLREMFFPRSNSTSHSLIQPGENLDRFTLRLPEEVRSQIMEASRMNRTKSCTVFTRVRSARRGYRRTASSGSWRARNHFNYERFDHQGWSDRDGSCVNLPSLPRTAPVSSGFGENQVKITAAPKNFQRSARSFHLSHTREGQSQIGEGSSDWLRSKSTQVQMVCDL